MDVPPHPHTGLQTVSWLFAGEIEHRDSLGIHAMVRPGELNLMTGGHGIAHSEVSTPAPPCCTASSCGWRCPTRTGDAPRDFQHHVPTPVRLDGATAAGLPRLAGRPDLAGRPPTPRCSARSWCSTPAASVTLASTGPSSTACWSTPGLSPSTAPQLGRGRVAYLAAGAAPSRWRTGDRPAASDPARRPAVRGGDRHVVELRRPQPTRRSPAPRGLAGRFRALRWGRGVPGPVQRLPAPPMPTVRLKPRLAPPGHGDPSAWG